MNGLSFHFIPWTQMVGAIVANSGPIVWNDADTWNDAETWEE